MALRVRAAKSGTRNGVGAGRTLALGLRDHAAAGVFHRHDLPERREARGVRREARGGRRESAARASASLPGQPCAHTPRAAKANAQETDGGGDRAGAFGRAWVSRGGRPARNPPHGSLSALAPPHWWGITRDYPPSLLMLQGTALLPFYHYTGLPSFPSNITGACLRGVSVSRAGAHFYCTRRACAQTKRARAAVAGRGDGPCSRH